MRNDDLLVDLLEAIFKLQGGIMRYPDPSIIAEKCVRRAQAAESDYEAGVRDPKEDWAKNTFDAEARYEEELKASMTRKSFGKGVKKAGTSHQQAMTILKGVEQRRWYDGVGTMADKMAVALEPVAAALRALSLPPKGIKGSPRQVERFTKTRDVLIKVGKKE